MSNMKIAAGLAVAATLGTLGVLEHRNWKSLRTEHQMLQQRLVEIEQQPDTRTPGDAALGTKPAGLTAEQLAELDALRREIGASQRQTAALAALRAQNRNLRAASFGNGSADPAEVEFQHENRRRINDLKTWGLLFALYADKHNGRLPDTWEQVSEQIPASERASFLQFANQNYDITYHGTTDAVSNRKDTILFRERQPRRSPSGTVVKAYGQVDGSARLLSESGTITFQDFEAKNIVQ